MLGEPSRQQPLVALASKLRQMLWFLFLYIQECSQVFLRFPLSVYSLKSAYLSHVSSVSECFANCCWAPAEVLTSLPTPKLNLHRTIKNTLRSLLPCGIFLECKRDFSIFDLVMLRQLVTSLENYNQGREGTHRIFYSNASCSFSLAHTRGTTRLQQELKPQKSFCSPVLVLAPWSDRNPVPYAGDEQLLTSCSLQMPLWWSPESASQSLCP